MGVALITGASAGLGTEFARLFARDGHSVILVARRKDRLQGLAVELKGSFPQVQSWVIEMDLEKIGAGRALFERVEALGVEVDFLVNNAGYGKQGLFSEHELGTELGMIDLNIRCLVEATHCFLPKMLARKSGRVLNVGSTAGFQPGPYMATYYASKAFVNSFSEALHNELRGTGVTCTVLAPGPTKTEFADHAQLNQAKLFKSGVIATAADVAREGYEAMLAGQDMRIAGWANKLSLQSQRLAPRRLVRKIAETLNK